MKLKIKIFVDGADLQEMLSAYRSGSVSGFTTNPTLMRKAGIKDYESFARESLATITELPISFEIFSDELSEMEVQANKIASWAPNVYVKIPITNTQGISTVPIIKKLSAQGVKLNITAVFTTSQVKEVVSVLSPQTPSVISIFGGRIANAGVDPKPIMCEAVQLSAGLPKNEILWASPREAYNIVEAEQCGCHIITVTPDILSNMKNFGKTLEQYSLETVQMFYRDAQSAGYSLNN